MSQLYSLEELVAATGGRAERLHVSGVDAVSIDSRDVAGNALFAAIRGVRMDGHDFVPAAINAGAVIAMVSSEKAVEFPEAPLLVVPDVLVALESLARHARARSGAKIVAVTGSAGKTSTKEAMRELLTGFGDTHASIKSFNNHWGVPLTMARMPETSRFGVFEIGMSHAGEITPLVKLVRPHVAVVTTIAAAHLEAFGSVDDIARAKAEIFMGLEPGGTAVLNADHGQLPILLAEAQRLGVEKVVTYGFGAEAKVQIGPPEARGWNQVSEVNFPEQKVLLRLQVPGRHMLANAVAALCVAREFELDLQQAASRLGQFGAPEGRGSVLMLSRDGETIEVIDESYNANPASMRAALEVFGERQIEDGRKILVLGDMYELGAQSRALHAELKPAVSMAGADLIFLVGEQMQALAEALGPDRVAGWAASVDEVAAPVLNALANGDTLMIKGSNGVRLSRLVALIRQEFTQDAPSSGGI